MKIKETNFKGLYLVEFISFKDNRGEFVKTIHQDTYIEHRLNWKFMESFYSVSHKDVLRGMHFQYAPHDHDKLVYVVTGRIIDVVLDLRQSSETYGKYFLIELSQENRLGLFIERGFAHGFLSLENNTVVQYHTTTMQNKEGEGGVKWNSFGAAWPTDNPILSERDKSFASFDPEQIYF